jgi:hypothetical protein
MPVIDYCRDCCGEITETDVVCRECGKRLRFGEPLRMSVGKWIGWAMIVAAPFVGFATMGGPYNPWAFFALNVGGIVLFTLSPWREPEPILTAPPTDDGTAGTCMVIVAGM